MTPLRVLRVYHSAVVGEYRERDRLLQTNHGYDMHLVCPPSWSEGGRLVEAEPHSPVPLHILSVAGRQHPNLFWYSPRALNELLRRLRPHIFDLHEEPYSLAVAAALRGAKRHAPSARVCVYTAQNLYKRYPPPFRRLERLALQTATAAYPCSTEAGEVLKQKGFRGNTHVIPLGVSVADVLDRKSRAEPRVGFVGRLEKYKGPRIALKAFAAASAGVQGTLTIVGAGTEEQALRDETSAAGLTERVRFTGAVTQEEALRHIQGFDILLVPSLTTPSWKEQFGRVAAQAMAAGTSVIASDSGSLREVVGDAGVLVPEGDVDRFAAELRRLLRSTEARRQLGDRARHRAVTHFSWDCVATKMSEMYQTMLTSPRDKSP